MNKFELVSPYEPLGDQPAAIKKLVQGLRENKRAQVLLGATGTGKTFTVSQVIAEVNRPTLVFVHNKTLAGQLYSEFKELFPNNRVEYFVSNFDYYQPEAYVPKSDTYIEKTAMINEELDMLRMSSLNAILERRDTIVVASVACIYASSDPSLYRDLFFSIHQNEIIDRQALIRKLVDRQYSRNDMELKRGTFRVKGDSIEISLGYTDQFNVRIELYDDVIERITEVDRVSGKVLNAYSVYNIFPANEYTRSKEQMLEACNKIERELHERLNVLESENKLVEKQRLEQRTLYDLEALRELGMCSGIENYSMHIDGRKPGQRPFNLFDYFPDDYLLVIDESHVSVPQVKGMFNGDRARKTTLVEYGFRLPSALENRPMRFDEFEKIINQVIFVSATPGDYELELTNHEVVEQIIRPTGLIDPITHVRPSKGQIDDIIHEINLRIEKDERVLITTLTVKMAEELTAYLKRLDLKVCYLHHETLTLERIEILRDLRKGKYDVLVGINLLREGLDLPEVSLSGILDADKEGFLRSDTSLIQTIGRAARNVNGKVIMYADRVTNSMQRAIGETDRRRAVQEAYNVEHGITPTSIQKKVRELIQTTKVAESPVPYEAKQLKKLSKKETLALVAKLEKDMRTAAKNLEFERAAELRDMIFELREHIRK